MAKSAREAALTVLERCRRNQAFSDTMLDSVVETQDLNQKDRALCTRLCYGVLQNMLLCDFYIDSFLTGSKKLEPKVRDILRLSVYQILFLDKIPAHAAVSEGVELCKKLGFSRASGLVNAVLRKIESSKGKLPEIPKDDITEYLSIKYSTPSKLVALFISDFGPEFTEELLRAANEPVDTTIQVNTLKTSALELRQLLEARGLEINNSPYFSDSFELLSPGDISRLSEHKDGLFYVQDTAARLSVLAASPKEGDTVLDACAAPGGKSFSGALMMNNKGRILARDIHEKKLKRILEGAKLLGIEVIEAAAMDASKPDKDLFGTCDIVIADVPCSGLGVIRKKPDIRYKDLDELTKLPETQLSILRGLAPCVKSGGVLLYSTCTVLKRENDGLIDRFLAEHTEFSPEPFELPEPVGKVEGGRISLFPHIHGTDGFYICKLRKSNEN